MFCKKTYREFRWAERLIAVTTIPQEIPDDKFWVKVKPTFRIRLTREEKTYEIDELRLTQLNRAYARRTYLECKPILFNDLGMVAKVTSGFRVLDRNDLTIEKL